VQILLTIAEGEVKDDQHVRASISETRNPGSTLLAIANQRSIERSADIRTCRRQRQLANHTPKMSTWLSRPPVQASHDTCIWYGDKTGDACL
jgi:hypothetical protein